MVIFRLKKGLFDSSSNVELDFFSFFFFVFIPSLNIFTLLLSQINQAYTFEKAVRLSATVTMAMSWFISKNENTNHF